MAARELGAIDEAVTLSAQFADSAARTYGAHSAISLEADAKLAYVQFLHDPTRVDPLIRLEQLQAQLQAKKLEDPAYALTARINLAAARLRIARPGPQAQGLHVLQQLDAEVRAGRLPDSTQTMRARLILAEALARQRDGRAGAVYAQLWTDVRAALPETHPYRLRCEAGIQGAVPVTPQN